MNEGGAVHTDKCVEWMMNAWDPQGREGRGEGP